MSTAPKGGVFSHTWSRYNQSYQTFNSLNAYILKGEGAQGMDMTFASLMARAFDEPDAIYPPGGARSVTISPDELTYRFRCARKRSSTTAPRSPRTTPPSR